jgi:hypothetical protein
MVSKEYSFFDSHLRPLGSYTSTSLLLCISCPRSLQVIHREKKLGICEKEKPMFRGRVIWLDDQLFKLDAENWRVFNSGS